MWGEYVQLCHHSRQVTNGYHLDLSRKFWYWKVGFMECKSQDAQKNDFSPESTTLQNFKNIGYFKNIDAGKF